MNTQEIFNYVTTKLLSHGNPWGNFFRNERGWGLINHKNPCERCARGWLQTSKAVESTGGIQMWSVSTEDQKGLFRNYYTKVGRLLTDLEAKLINDLEKIFECQPDTTWIKEFADLAKEYDLQVPDYFQDKVEVAETEEVNA